MAARRLVIVMIVLLVISSIAAALAPVREPATTTEEPATEARPLGAEQPSRGRLVRAVASAGGRVETVRARVGDQLQLRVGSRRPLTLVIPRLGVTEDAGPGSPAIFDLLLTEPGRFEVRPLAGGDTEVDVLVADGRNAPHRSARR